MLSLNVIVALTPSLLFFYLRGESEGGSWGPDYPPDPPRDPPVPGRTGAYVTHLKIRPNSNIFLVPSKTKKSEPMVPKSLPK